MVPMFTEKIGNALSPLIHMWSFCNRIQKSNQV
jgi:hypothetical protein